MLALGRAYFSTARSLLTKTSHRTMSTAERLVVVGIPFPDEHRERLAPHFAEIAYFADGKATDAAALEAADVLYGNLRHISTFDAIKNVKFAQLSNAGADDVLANAFWKEDERASKVLMATVAGVHMAPISQYFIMSTLAMFHRLQAQIVIGQTEKRWASDLEIGGRLFVEELQGKTVGILGYGHIGRECARISTAFGAKVLAATSEGKKKPQEGYIEPHTGDPDGSIPESWYSTRDASAFKTFLSKTDVLLLALPSTSNTRHLLSATTLAYLPPTAVIVNVGRGDAIDTAALLAALDAKKLGGAALDVTDPEPLPAGHPLFGRSDVLVTPHLSGRTIHYYQRALVVFEENVKRWKAGEPLWNSVDYQKGY